MTISRGIQTVLLRLSHPIATVLRVQKRIIQSAKNDENKTDCKSFQTRTETSNVGQSSTRSPNGRTHVPSAKVYCVLLRTSYGKRLNVYYYQATRLWCIRVLLFMVRIYTRTAPSPFMENRWNNRQIVPTRTVLRVSSKGVKN